MLLIEITVHTTLQRYFVLLNSVVTSISILKYKMVPHNKEVNNIAQQISQTEIYCIKTMVSNTLMRTFLWFYVVIIDSFPTVCVQ